MNIEIGNGIENKTWRFLVPCLKDHGEEFEERFNSDVHKLAYGIEDKLFKNIELLKNKCPVFILCDRGILNEQFEGFLTWLKYQDYYISDYQYDVRNLRYYMLVIDVPKNRYSIYNNFLLGKYSEMYSTNELKHYIDIYSDDYRIMSKDERYRGKFISKIEKEFGTDIKSDSSFYNCELEFPYKLKEEDEVFNFKIK